MIESAPPGTAPGTGSSAGLARPAPGYSPAAGTISSWSPPASRGRTQWPATSAPRRAGRVGAHRRPGHRHRGGGGGAAAGDDPWWDATGTQRSQFPDGIVTTPGDVAAAGLAGLEQGYVVTIPALPDYADWQACNDARINIGARAIHPTPGARYT